jgi:hypothetical protein
MRRNTRITGRQWLVIAAISAVLAGLYDRSGPQGRDLRSYGHEVLWPSHLT